MDIVTNKKYPCPDEDCLFATDNSRWLKEHCTKYHPIEKYAYACDLCTASYSTARSLKIHKNQHQNSFRIMCPEKGCSQRLTSEASLKRHREEFHEDSHSNGLRDSAAAQISVPFSGNGSGSGISQRLIGKKRKRTEENDKQDCEEESLNTPLLVAAPMPMNNAVSYVDTRSLIPSTASAYASSINAQSVYNLHESNLYLMKLLSIKYLRDLYAQQQYSLQARGIQPIHFLNQQQAYSAVQSYPVLLPIP